MEKTYSLFILKPGFVGFEKKFEELLNENKIKIEVRRKGVLSLEKAEVHYAEHKGKGFYDTLVNYMTKGEYKDKYKFDSTTITMVVSSMIDGETEADFITRTRAVVKEVLRPIMTLKREDFANLSDEVFKDMTITANGVHASDSPESAKREIENLMPEYFEDKCR